MSTKAKLHVVFPYYFSMILKSENFTSSQVKHKTEFRTSKAQCNDSSYEDK